MPLYISALCGPIQLSRFRAVLGGFFSRRKIWIAPWDRWASRGRCSAWRISCRNLVRLRAANEPSTSGWSRAVAPHRVNSCLTGAPWVSRRVFAGPGTRSARAAYARETVECHSQQCDTCRCGHVQDSWHPVAGLSDLFLRVTLTHGAES